MANPQNAAIYFTSLELENVRCFGKCQKLDLTDGSGNPAQWTLLLGDNGVGKTTLLQCLAWMRPVPKGGPQNNVSGADDESDEPAPLRKGSLGPSLSDEENEVLEGLLRTGKKHEILLRAELCQNTEFRSSSQSKTTKPGNNSKRVNTGVRIVYSKKGILEEIRPQGNTKIETIGEYHEPFIIAYGANRQIGLQNLIQSELEDPIAARLSHVTILYDAEEILQNLDYAAAKKNYKGRENDQLLKVQRLLAQVLPDLDNATDIEINAPKMLSTSTGPSGVRIKTFSGSVPLSALSLGYQTTLAWTLDLAWRLFAHYPKSANPLEEPAVVLIDEIDLHLHPLWQRTIMDSLTELFPRAQFIATAHSPLMVQSAPCANLVVVQKDNDEVRIINEPDVVRSWRVDQILTSELFGVPASRDRATEKLFKEKESLLDKPSLSTAEKARLSKIDSEIAALDTAESAEDRKAMELIRDAAALLKKHKIPVDDQSN